MITHINNHSDSQPINNTPLVFFKPAIQPKLTINQPNDVYEQEADAMANKVMRMSDSSIHQSTFFQPSMNAVQRKCQHCEEEEKQLHRKEINNDESVADASTENYIGSLNSKGKLLTPDERSFFEPGFGYDFSDVHLHTNSEANQSAKNINALAYTHSNNIVFGANQYQPDTENGKKLMAHELTHVVQQGNGIATKKIQREWDWARAGLGAIIGGVGGAVVGGLAGGLPGAIIGGVGGAVAGGLIGGLTGGSSAVGCPNMKNVSVDFVRLAGSTRSPSTDLSVANRVFSPCCVQFSVGQDVSVSATTTQSWLGGDTDLDLSGVTCPTPTAEERNMYNKATTAYNLSSTLKVFYPGSTSGYTALAFSRPPYCAGGFSHHVVIYPSALSDTLAHEFGHIFLNSGLHSGIDNPSDTRNLMLSPGRTASDLDKTQCATIFSNA